MKRRPTQCRPPDALMQFGNMGKDLAMYNTKLFAEKVMPQLTGVFSEWRTAGGRSR
jgi:hypothetical protein